MTLSRPTRFPASALWDYSLRLYAQPDVESTCLNLQQRGLDVNCLLLALWLAASGRESPQAAHWHELQTQVAPWRRDVVEALRTVRQRLKALGASDSREIRDLRTAVQACELDAEHIEQLMLEAAVSRTPQARSPDQQLTAAGLNLRRYYCAALGMAPDAAAARDLCTLLRAAFPAAGASAVARALAD